MYAFYDCSLFYPIAAPLPLREGDNVQQKSTINENNNSWKGVTGFINGEMIKKEIADYKERIFYLCGPPGMVKVLQGIISELGISDNRIRVEYFTGYS